MDLEEDSRYMGSKFDHLSKLADALNQQRLEQSELCDVTITVNGKEMKAHWCILVTCPFFESMFSSGLAEKTSGKIQIQIGKTAAMEKVLDYLYVGKIELSLSNIGDILEVVDYLQFSDLKKICNDFLSMLILDSKTCVKICLISSLYDLPIHEKAMKYMKGHLPIILLGQDILTLTQESVLALLNDETLSYVSQEAYLKFLVRWVKYNPACRKDEFHELFKALKIQDISESVVYQTFDDKELNELLPINDFKSAFEDARKKIDKKQPSHTRDVILVGGGKLQLQSGTQLITEKLFAFSLHDEKWSQLCHIPVSMEKPVIRSGNNGKIYFVNKSPNNWSSWSAYNRFCLYIFEIANKTWERIKLDNDIHLMGFFVHDLILCGNRVFLLGRGYKDIATGESCKLIEVKENKSLETNILFDCNEKDVFYGCSIDDEKVGIIYECYQKKRFSIKYYNLKSKTLSDPSRARSCLSTLSFTKILVYKGEIIQVDLKKKTIRKFNPSENLWMSFPKMSPAPFELTMSAMFSFENNQLYIFGGDKTKKSYKYLCDKRKWIELDDMPVQLFHTNGATATTSLPAEFVACHVNCPHCFFVHQNSDVTYPRSEISDNEEEEDTIEDSDYYDEDGYDWDNDCDEDDDDSDRRSDCVLM